jgi:hypothetical protein
MDQEIYRRSMSCMLETEFMRDAKSKLTKIISSRDFKDQALIVQNNLGSRKRNKGSKNSSKKSKQLSFKFT